MIPLSILKLIGLVIPLVVIVRVLLVVRRVGNTVLRVDIVAEL